jgi:hypothetical protein
MSYKIQSRVFEFDEVGFLRKLIVEFLIIRVIGFTSLKFVRFDPFKVKVKDITINIMVKG